MIEVTVPGYDHLLAAFDGCVLEIVPNGGDREARRIQGKFLSVTVSGPDKGLRSVDFRGQLASFTNFLKLDDPALGTLEPLFDALKAAGVDIAAA